MTGVGGRGEVMTGTDRIRLILHYIAILAAGLPGALVTVITAVYLTLEMGVDPFVVGCFVNGSTVLGILITHYAGKGAIDRRSPIALSIVSLGAGALSVLCLLGAGSSLWLLVLAAVFRAASQLLTPSLFMFDEKFRPHGTGSGMYTTRLVVSVVWILGPPISFYLYWVGAFALVAAAVVGLSIVSAGLIWMLAQNSAGGTASSTNFEPSPVERSSMSTSTTYLVLVCVTAANVLHAICLPLYLLQTLRVSDYWPGWNMALQAAVEVVVIYYLPRLIRVCSEETVLRVGLAGGVLYFCLLTFVSSAELILGLQVLYGAHFALSSVVCLGILRRTSQKQIGSVASKFVNAGKLGGLLGTSVFGLLAGWTSFGVLASLGSLILVGSAGAVSLLPLFTNRILTFWSSSGKDAT